MGIIPVSKQPNRYDQYLAINLQRKHSMKILAIDPGASGYLCQLNTDTENVVFHKTTIKPHILVSIIQRFCPNIIVIEDVHSVFGSGAKANFNFGFNVGHIHGILGSAYVGIIHRVQPKLWQKTIGVTSKGKAIKKEVADICIQHYPNADLYGKRGGLQDGKSDSLGIALHIFKSRKLYENISE